MIRFTENGRAVALFDICVDIPSSGADAREILERVNVIARTKTVPVFYPGVTDSWVAFEPRASSDDPIFHHVVFTLKDTSMDILAAERRFEAKQTQAARKEQADSAGRRRVFVFPAADELPNDGMIKYMTVETIFDLAKVPSHVGVAFREDQLDILKVVADHPDLFDIDISVLSGVPDSIYTSEFEHAVWAYDKVAYAPLIAELALDARSAQITAAADETVHDGERRQTIRKTGLPKVHTGYAVNGVAADGADDGIADDPES